MSLREIISFILLIFLQLFFFNAITLFDKAHAFVFLLPLLSMPLSWDYKLVTFLAFAIGLTVDLSILKLGIHASSAVFIITLRGYWIDIITPQINPEDKINLKLHTQSITWSISYFTPLVFLYSLVYHILSDLQLSLNTFWKFFTTGLYSSLLILLIYALFIKTAEKR